MLQRWVWCKFINPLIGSSVMLVQHQIQSCHLASQVGVRSCAWLPMLDMQAYISSLHKNIWSGRRRHSAHELLPFRAFSSTFSLHSSLLVNPSELAIRWSEYGSQWIHVVLLSSDSQTFFESERCCFCDRYLHIQRAHGIPSNPFIPLQNKGMISLC